MYRRCPRRATTQYMVIGVAIFVGLFSLHLLQMSSESLAHFSKSTLYRPPLLPHVPGYTKGLCEDALGWTNWANKFSKDNIRRDILLTNLNWDYIELGFNLYNHAMALGLDIVLVAEDCNVYKCLTNAIGQKHVLPPLFGDSDSDAQNFNTEGFGRMVRFRPVYMHFFLNRGINVIWEDIDSFPMDDLRKYWTRGADITAVDDSNTGCHYDSNNLCSCLIFSQATYASMRFLETWMSMMSKGAKRNQLAFNDALKSAKSDHGLSVVILPRSLFPNGATLDANNSTSRWVHANYRIGKEKKLEYLTHHGMNLIELRKMTENLKCSSPSKTLENVSFSKNWKSSSCTSNGSMLFQKCFCFVGYDGTTCSKEWDSPPPPCSAYDDRCYYHPAYGVAKVGAERWAVAQKAGNSTWAQQISSDRNEEHAEVFGQYSSLLEQDVSLGDVIEFGSGPFTQSLTIFDKTQLIPDSVTLLEPLAEIYMKTVTACRYRNGSLGRHPTKILPLTIEKYFPNKKYDTIVAINFIEHVQDAFLAYQKIIDSLKEGGILIFHQRFWPDHMGTETKNGREFDLHPIRLSSRFGHWFATEFEIFFEREQAERWGNMGHYWIGRKTSRTMMSHQTQLHSELIQHNKKLSEIGFDEKNIWGNIFNAEDSEQSREYMSFVRQPWVKTVCEVGFAAGHSSLVFHSAKPNAQIFSFDDFGKERLTSEALKIVQRKINLRMTRGDSRKTLVDFRRVQSNVTCDIVSIDGAHHGDFPLQDINNFKYLVGYPNIVLIDDYHKIDWPAVHSAVDVHIRNGSLNLLHAGKSTVIFRGKEKSWAIAQYDLITVICATYTNERIANLHRLITDVGKHPLVQQFILIWQGEDLSTEISKLIIDMQSIATAKITLVQRPNSLNNRYDPTLPISTRAVLMLDDDLLVPPETITSLFQRWKLNPMQVHSFGGPRIVSKSGYQYEVDIEDPNANFLLPRYLFHRKLMDVYFNESNKEIRDYVDSQSAHCDDIAFALVTCKFTGYPLHYVEGKHTDLARPGLGHQPNRLKLRDECARQLVSLVGIEPKPIHRSLVSN